MLRNNRRLRGRKSMAGFTLVELMVVSIIASITLAGGMWAARQAMMKDMYRAQGDTLKAIGNAGGNEYVLRYYAELQKAAPNIPGVANPLRPTLPELKALGLPVQDFANTGWNNLAYAFRLQRVPAGCTPPACDINGLVYLDGALTDPSTGALSAGGLGEAISAIGGDGGFSDDVTPGTISGFGGQWSQGNPNGATAGILAMQIGYATLGYQQFLRRDGSLPMLGTLNMQDGAGVRHNIASANTIDAQSVTLPGATNAQSLRVGNSIFYGDSVNSAVRSSVGGGLYVQDMSGAAADIRQARDVNASGTVTANVVSSNESYVNGYFRSRGDGGWYSEKWGGGWLMYDATWIRAFGNKSIYTQAVVQADTRVSTSYIDSWGRVRAGEYVQVDGWGSEGAGCSPNGLIGRDGAGTLTCENGIWKRPGGAGNGWYVSKGNYASTTGWIYNGSGKTQTIVAYGGTGNNVCDLSGVIDVWGEVARDTDNNNSWAKTCSISFPVPSGTSWYVNSNPLGGQGSGFTVSVYQ